MNTQVKKDDNCIFCKIIDKKIPSNVIYEDEFVLAFLTIEPHTKGHTIVIPKSHCKDIFEIDDFYYEKLMSAVKKISRHYKDNCNIDGVNIVTNSDKSSGQEVFHIHYHILPRKNNDGAVIYTKPELKDFDLKKITEELKLS